MNHLNLTNAESLLIECALTAHAKKIESEGATAFKRGDLYLVGESAGRLAIIQDLLKRLPVQI
jgi:hypothetical protein